MCYAGAWDVEEITEYENQARKRHERKARQIESGDPRDPDWEGHFYEDEEE